MMRRNFCRDLHALSLGFAHHFHAPPGAQMSDVVFPAGQFSQDEIARNHGIFGCRGNSLQTQPRGVGAFVHDAAFGKIEVFAVLDHRKIENLRILQSAAEKPAVHDRLAVVGNPDNAGLDHLADFGQRFALLLLGDRADRKDQRGRGASCFGDDVGRNGRIVV